MHDEVPGAPGYTEEGHRAASGNVGWSSGGRDLGVQPEYEFATLFHRGEFLYAFPRHGRRLARAATAVVWVEESEAGRRPVLAEARTRAGSFWVTVPAAGQTAVPLQLEA